VVTSLGFKEYGTSIFRSWSSDKLKLKTNVIYTYFNRKTLNEQGLGSVLFNALNTPSTLSPYNDANGDFTVVPATTGLGNEINPSTNWNTYNDFDFKKLNGNFGLDYKLFEGFVYQVHWVLIPQIASQEFFAKEINYGGKFWCAKKFCNSKCCKW
jgi:hypothetical protein